MSLSIIERAIIYATYAHAGIKRKGSGIPYIFHPIEAAEIVAGLTKDSEIIAAAVLHDVVEDTPRTIEEIEQEFGKRVATMVRAETENKRRDQSSASTWRIRKEETIAFLQTQAGEAEKMIALGDKLANLRAIHKDELRVGEAMWEKFNQKDKNQHGWYYREVAKALESLSETAAWKELNCLCGIVFQQFH